MRICGAASVGHAERRWAWGLCFGLVVGGWWGLSGCVGSGVVDDAEREGPAGLADEARSVDGELVSPLEALAGMRDAFVLRVDPRSAIEAGVPRGIDPAVLEPLVGEALERAETSLAEVRDALGTPAFLLTDQDVDAIGGEDGAERAEPTLGTQRLFAAALQQGLEGQGSGAVRLLEAAVRQAPDEPLLLQRLARGWASLGNRSRAMVYFQQAVRADSQDLESVVAMGRLLVESGNAESGTTALLHALEGEEALERLDPALPMLTRFYASSGLRQMGYARAAAGLLDTFLDTPPSEALRRTRYGAEYVFLGRRAAAHEVVRGDLYGLLSDFRSARMAYERAARGGASGDDLVRRIVYSDLRLGRLDEATQRVLEMVRAESASPASLALVEYLVAEGVPSEPVLSGLRAMRGEVSDPDAVMLALASALPKDAAVALLLERLDEDPTEPRAYQRLLSLMFSTQGTAADRAVALERVAAAMSADPGRAAQSVGALFALTPDLSVLPVAFEALDPAARGTSVMRTLEALVWAERGENERAAELLDGVVSPGADGSAVLALAWVERARLFALAGDFEAAQLALDRVDAQAQDPRLGQLRVGVLMNLDRNAEAYALLERLIREQPENVAFLVEQSRLLVRMDRVPEAEQALLGALNRFPKDERIYAQLLALYDSVGAGLENHQASYQRLVRRMLETIPGTRIARLTLAGILEVQGDLPQAERLLNELLEENPGDRDALIVLVDVYNRTDRGGEAAAVVERMLLEAPNDREVLEAAVRHFQAAGDQERMKALQEPLLLAQPVSARRSAMLARLYFDQDRTDEALAMLDESLAISEARELPRWTRAAYALLREQPLEVAEERLVAMQQDAGNAYDLRKVIAYELVNAYEKVGRSGDGDALMEGLLAERPDDTDLNNQVGYTWAQAGRRLDEAEVLIARALEGGPQQSAYLDSMGWVLYKKGDFVGAERWLVRANTAPGGDNPVIVDHLGDTYYRLGRLEEAEAKWEQARASMALPENQRTGDPEMASLVERTTAKLEALAAGEGAVPVAWATGD